MRVTWGFIYHLHLATQRLILYAWAIKNIDNYIYIRERRAMRDKPILFGFETEYAISVKNGSRGSRMDILYAPYDVVEAVKELNVPFIDRGLEMVEDIAEHEEAEKQARQNLFEHKFANRAEVVASSSKTLRQRLGCSGFVLETGARYYVDLGHPEYSTPETENPRTIVLVQKAGDIIVEECRKRAENLMRMRTGSRDLAIHIHRNNSDGLGHSYAGHENYSLSPSLFDQIVDWYYWVLTPLTHAVLKFLVTRSIVIGSGKVGFEDFEPASYQISQRADFMVRPIANSTIKDRGIINTRNDPLARYSLTRRFHTICGDSNMSELSIYLKCGITALFFKMLEQGYIQSASGNLMMPLCDSVHAFHRVSRDLTLREKLPLDNETQTTALETQMQYCQLAKSFIQDAHLESVWADVVQKWEAVLNGLDGNRFIDVWAGNLDWVIKERLLKQYQKQHHIDNPTDMECQSLALAYHDINPNKSIYDRLLANGKIMRIVRPEEITRMVHEPPTDTRAYLRGMLVKNYSSHLVDIGWDYAVFTNGMILDINHPRKGTKEQIDPLMADNPSFDVFFERIQNMFKTRQHRRFPARDRHNSVRTMQMIDEIL